MEILKEILKDVYKFLYNEELIQVIKEEPEPVTIEKTHSEKLYDFALTFYDTDPTPKDEQPDEYACVQSLTTILSKHLQDFPIMTYTPKFLEYIKTDKRFKATTEFKKGNIIISPTESGNGTVVGHTGIIGEGGKILSNSSATGKWFDKFDQVSWITRYSKSGQLNLYLFELVV